MAPGTHMVSLKPAVIIMNSAAFRFRLHFALLMTKVAHNALLNVLQPTSLVATLRMTPPDYIQPQRPVDLAINTWVIGAICSAVVI